MTVAIGMPLRGSTAHAGATLAMTNATRGGMDWAVRLASTSLLPFTFNTLWAGVLNERKTQGFTHFAMIHDDVMPACGWLDVLMMELMEKDASVVSAIVPIKDKRGLTSTAMDVTGDEWMPRRLTMTEVYTDFPETWTHPALLMNTGLWVCRLDEPWVDKIWFEQHDRIAVKPDGDYFAQTKSEDWNFSRRLRALGYGDRMYVTRKVPLIHESDEYPNTHPWGQWNTDKEGLAGAPVSRPMHADDGRATKEPEVDSWVKAALEHNAVV